MTDQPAPKGGVLIIGQRAWGYGAEAKTARDNFRRNGGKLNRAYQMYRFPDATEFHGVDQMGYAHYVGDGPTEVFGRDRTAA